MDVPDERFLTIKEFSKGVSNNSYQLTKTRMLYFLKTKSQALPGHNYERLVLVGDMTDDSLKYEVAQHIYMPLLSNPRNQKMSELVAKDVMDNLHTFLANIQIEIGRTEGKTILPLPADEDLDENLLLLAKNGFMY